MNILKKKRLYNNYEKKNNKFQKKNSNSLSKLSLFQKNDSRFSKKCPFSSKNAPIIDYKNIGLLKNLRQKMEKFYPQKLHLFLMVNKKN